VELKLIIRAEENEERVFPEPSQVEVREQLGQATTFTLTFSEDICENEFQLLKNQYFNPLKGIGIFLQVEKREICLVKGIITGQQITLKHGGEGSQLKITGSDNSTRLGWAKEKRKWGKRVDKDEIVAILSTIQKDKKAKAKANYQFKKYRVMENEFELEGDPIEPKIKKISGDSNEGLSFSQEQMQNDSDLAFIRRLASEKGYYFWISYDKEGEEIANFNKLPLKGFSEKNPYGDPNNITLNLSGENNEIDDFSISWNVEKPTSVKAVHTDRKTGQKKKAEEPEAPQPKLGNMTLKQITDDSISDFQSPAVFDEGDMADRNKAALDEAEWFIKANCSTSYERLCKKATKDAPTPILTAHTVINIAGAGSRYSGEYLVAGVSHSIDGGEYKMQLELKRNAWIRTTEDKVTEFIEDVVDKISNIF